MGNAGFDQFPIQKDFPLLFGRISGASRRKPGFSGLRYRSGRGAARRGCCAPLQSLARGFYRIMDP
jgi:hypothetical protein